MKRTLFAATVAAQIIAFPTLSFAAVDAAADAKTQALIQRCIDNSLLLPEQVQTMNDAELNAALVDCAASLQTAAVAPAPIVRSAPVVVEDAPVVVHRRQRFVAAEPEFVGGGEVADAGGGGGFGGVATPININSNNTTNSGNGDGNVFGNGNASGGNGGIGVGGGGGIGNGGGGGAGNGGGGAGAGGGNGAGGAANNVKLNNIQKDALIGNGLKPGEAKASSVAKDLGNGLKSVTNTRVSKLQNGNVRVTQTTQVVNAANQAVGTPNIKTQSFTPADVNVLKQAHGNAPLDNIPTFAKKSGTFAGLKNGEPGNNRFAAMRARLAAAKDGKTGVAAGAGNNRFAAMREKLAAAKDGKTGVAAGGHNRFAEMRAKMAAAKNGKLGTDVTKGSAHNRFADMMKRRHTQTAQSNKGSGAASSVGKIAKKSDRGVFHPTRQAKSSTGVKHASKVFAQHGASKAAKVAKSSGGKSHGALRRFASR